MGRPVWEWWAAAGSLFRGRGRGAWRASLRGWVVDQSLCASCGHGQPEGLSEWLRRTGWEGSWTKLRGVEGRGLKSLSLAFFSPSFPSRAGRRGSMALEKGGDWRAGRGGSHLLRTVGWGEGCREPLAPPPTKAPEPSLCPPPAQAQAVWGARPRAARVAASAVLPWNEGTLPPHSAPGLCGLPSLCAQEIEPRGIEGLMARVCVSAAGSGCSPLPGLALAHCPVFAQAPAVEPCSVCVVTPCLCPCSPTLPLCLELSGKQLR